MAEKKLRPGQKVRMVSVDELLGVEGEESSLELEIEKIQSFQNHPFKVVDDDKMEELVNSIRQNGVLTPVLVRPTDDGGYEMISGHRRMHAAQRAGLRKIPAIIRELTDDEATIVMVEANSQREEVLPSEKAFAYKMRYEAMKRQGSRRDLTSYQVGTKLRADEELAKDVGESKNQFSGGARVGSGRKKKSLTEKIDNGLAASVIALPEPEEMSGEDVPPIKDFLKAAQKSGIDLCAADVFKGTFLWLKERGCDRLVNTQLIEQYLQE